MDLPPASDRVTEIFPISAKNLMCAPDIVNTKHTKTSNVKIPLMYLIKKNCSIMPNVKIP